MSIPRMRRAAVAGAITIGALALIAGPADAKSSSRGSSSGTTANVNWIEVGALPGIAGNVHVGGMFIDGSTQNASIHGGVADWTCPEGELPPTHGGPHFDEEPPPETNCVHEDFRFLGAGPGAVTWKLDKKLAKGTLTGRLTVSDHGGGATAYPPVNMTLTGVGSVATSRFSDSYSDGTWTYTFRYTSSYRQAAVTGVLGPMNFTDDADDQSQASVGTYKDMYRSRSR